MSWWKQVFELSSNQRIKWVFGLDGLPHQSHIYRIGSKGEEVWEVMKYGVSLGAKIEWQLIPFGYNQNNIDEAIQMAKDHGMGFILRRTTRNFKRLPDDLRKQLQPDKKFLYKYGKVLGGTHKTNEKILDIPL